MRLIDADALHAQIQQDYDLFANSTYLPDKARRDELSNVIARIINAPIVEAMPARCGKWVKDEEESANHAESIYRCSACLNWEAWGNYECTPFCPYCGAKMAGPIWR